ncbi:MAG: hypothetical protein VB047_08485 [Anaerotignum propionicum]|uniref:hypothetical protein n=1 Tax=Anaerotignum propionicum TaxID=28446 RepID=UPI002B20D67F|nr:hypothetical protein [Anaerotignum propionicum]MEA5057582.1 hypothetical protein [Anaerotignum propionicum]
MGIFDKFSSSKALNQQNATSVLKNDTTEFAYQLLLTQIGGDINRKYIPKIESFLKKHETRIDILKATAELCHPFDTPKKLYISSTAYVWAGATCRKQAIECLTKYIELGGTWEGFGEDYLTTLENNISIPRSKLNLAFLYLDLSKAYEGEYLLDEAAQSARESLKFYPGYPSYNQLARVLIKLGLFDDALNELDNFRSSRYYSEDFFVQFNKLYIEIKDKKARGYKYKPRPQR